MVRLSAPEHPSGYIWARRGVKAPAFISLTLTGRLMNKRLTGSGEAAYCVVENRSHADSRSASEKALSNQCGIGKCFLLALTR